MIARVDDVEYAHLLAMRVAVAIDVLAQLRAQRIRALSGYYVRTLRPSSRVLCAMDDRADLQTVVDDLGICDVCAVGASLLSYARLFDNVKLKNNSYDLGLKIEPDGETGGARETLMSLLGDRFVDTVECAFEGWTLYQRTGVEFTPEWGHKGTEERMVRIMTGIIQDGGELEGPELSPDELCHCPLCERGREAGFYPVSHSTGGMW